MMKRIIKFLLVVGLLHGAFFQTQSSGQDAKASPRPSGKESTLSIANLGSWYRLIVLVNKEPTFGGTFNISRDLQGYPLKAGTNEIRIIATPFAFRPRYIASLNVSIDLGGGDSGGTDVRARFKGSETIEKTITFDLEPAEMRTNRNYELLPSLDSEKSNIVKTAAIDIAKIIGSRDLKRTVELLRLDQSKVIAAFPSWYFDTKAKTGTIAVDKTTDVDLVLGERFAMVIPSLSFLQTNRNAGMSFVTNAGTFLGVVESSVMFCRQSNHWCLVRQNSDPVELPKSILPLP